MTKKNEPLYNQLSRGVYVEGQGVVQPGERIKAKADDDAVDALTEAGALGTEKPEGSAADAGTIPDDPHPPTVELDAGFPGDLQDNDNEKEADNAA